MQLKSLSLRNFRLFESLDIKTPNQIILITGDNAQGKTSLLEAIYYIATLSSFHASSDRQLIRFNARRNKEDIAVSHIIADFETNGQTRHIEIRLILQPDRNGNPRYSKEILIDNAKKKTGDAIGKFNAVLFLPEMTQIIDGAPEMRRKYLTLMIAQANPHYVQKLNQYNQAITQRNALLKLIAEKQSVPEHLDIWDQNIASLGAYLIKERIKVINQLELEAQFTHHELSHGKESFKISYTPSFDPARPNKIKQNGLFETIQFQEPIPRDHLHLEEIEQLFLESLKKSQHLDILRGVTTIGPHRDEIRFFSNNTDLGKFGSRGQIRTSLIALKFAESDWLKSATGQQPVMLFDEVLAELDQHRRKDLLRYLLQNQQKFLTTADLNLFSLDFLSISKLWKIQNGIIKYPEK